MKQGVDLFTGCRKLKGRRKNSHSTGHGPETYRKNNIRIYAISAENKASNLI
jgi:hypothetical protein